MSDGGLRQDEEPWAVPELVEMLSDEMLLRAFGRSGGRGDPEARIVLAEIERRGLEI